MSRLTPRTHVLRALFARSGNQCAFPGCTHVLINESNEFVAQVCHIEAASAGGERFNPNSTDELRRDYSNLILLCYQHHVETDDVEKYPVKKMRDIKTNHEQIFEKSIFKIDESALYKLKEQMDEYWEVVECANKQEHSSRAFGFAMDVDGKAGFLKVIKSVHATVLRLDSLLNVLRESDERLLDDLNAFLGSFDFDENLLNAIPYYQNPFVNRNWETHNLSVPNGLARLKIDLLHLEVKYLEEYLFAKSNDLKAKERLKELKDEMMNLAKSVAYVD